LVSKPPVAKPRDSSSADSERRERLEIYGILVEMADRVSQRRQAANNFYLSVNTALVGGSAYLRTIGPNEITIFVLSIAGVCICALWAQNIRSYKTLNEAKFSVINNIESRLLEQPFAEEWKNLDPDGDGTRHKPFHKVESVVPWVFAGVYLVQSAVMVPWRLIGSSITLACS